MKWLVIGAYLLSVLYVHLRGKVRLPLRRQLFDHSAFMAPVNVFIYLFSKPPGTPFIPLDRFPQLAPLRQNWETIRDEAERLRMHSYAYATDAEAEAEEAGEGAGPDGILKNGWKQFFLKWYDTAQPSARHLCPQTFALLQSIPQIKVATFSELPPGAHLASHRDPYAGFLRYHLGLATPNDDSCFIEVDGQRHTWRDGEAMLFDETCVHWALNNKETGRLILLCDIERPMRFRWAQAINHMLGHMLMTATNAPDTTGGQAGPEERRARMLRKIGHYRRRFKSWNLMAYRVTLAVSVAGLAALLYAL
jgi:beta-hydroxylase